MGKILHAPFQHALRTGAAGRAVLAIALFAILAAGCAGSEGSGTPAPKPATGPGEANALHTKGVTLTPRSFSQADFSDFLSKAKEAGGVVGWAGDWDELAKSDGGPAVVAGLAERYNYTPVIELQFFDQKNGSLLRPLDNATKERYRSEAVAFAAEHKPPYLGLGIEVNTLYERSPEDFDGFASFFSDVYDSVKAVSPETKVFTVFQLERMEGLGGGLYGSNGSEEWQLLDRFPKSDIVAFTTYPGLFYKDPSDIPSGYYQAIRSHTSKPIAFTEVGWHSAASPAGWESSESEQASFAEKFLNQSGSPRFEIWSFLYDQNASEPFSSMGLYGGDGKAKEAWQRWVDG